MDDSWETHCPEIVDGFHCSCWYDGEECCACYAPACPFVCRKCGENFEDAPCSCAITNPRKEVA